jgi:hypothetical protein
MGGRCPIRMNKRSSFIFATIALLAGVPILLPLFAPWSPVNCRDVEIDLNSGKKRISRYFYGIPVRRQIVETRLSSEVSGVESTERWVLVSRFGPYVNHSPHYVYHSAAAQVRMLELIWEAYELDAPARQSTGKGLLREWQTTGSDSSAEGYLRRVFEEAKALQ